MNRNAEKIKDITCSIAAAAAAVLFIWAGRETAISAKNAVMLCLNVMIPSLYAFMVIARLLISTDAFRLIGKYLSFLSERLFHISGEAFSVILISQAAGYPVGAGLLDEMHRCGHISRDEAEKLLCFCIAPGPAYIMTVCGAADHEGSKTWFAVFIAVICGNLIPMIISSPFRKKPETANRNIQMHISPEMFTSAVASAGSSMSMICGMIIFFAAFMGAAGKLGLLRLMSEGLSAVTDIPTVECYPFVKSFFEISSLTAVMGNSCLLMPAIAAMLSFGGICVHLQIMSVCTGFSPRKAILSRFPSAVISFFVCRLLMPRYYGFTSVAVMADNSDIQIKSGDYTPILSIFLLIMTIFILSQKTMVKSKKM